MANVQNISREQLTNDLEASGLKFKGQGRGGEFMEFTDKQGRLRVKTHPPDPRTPYHHIHIYDSNGRPLSSELNVVTRRSEESHIEIQPLNDLQNDGG